MKNRKEQLEEVAKKIKELEKSFQVIIISDNGYTDALIVDQISGDGYHYHSTKGRITPFM